MKQPAWAFASHWSHAWGAWTNCAAFTTLAKRSETQTLWNKSSRLRIPQCWRFTRRELCASARSGEKLMGSQLPINDPG